MKGGAVMVASKNSIIDRKIINVTGKRQVTIPLKFYEQLQFGKEVECFLTHDAVMIRPLSTSDDGFAVEILKDLVAQGYSGDGLLTSLLTDVQTLKKLLAL
jgi:bifunctional DNA-binding transcriptional regulator/antitoxin component of YhaV-PrlF toxin-antitoxin module